MVSSNDSEGESYGIYNASKGVVEVSRRNG